MLLIALSWIYILVTTTNLGFILDRIFGLNNKNFVVTILLGLFSVTLLASFWAVFGRINLEFHLFLLALNFLLLLKFKTPLFNCYRLFWDELKILSGASKFFLLTITLLILAQCASIPYVIDNESYYIQTIKWLNEYGFVKGLVNLHLFLGQVSGWHITQSAFNFSFLYENFNDLSGFCLLLGNLFSIQKINEYYKNNNKNYLIIGLLPLGNLFFFQFISAPSPDIPVYILSFILFFYILEHFKKCSFEIFSLVTILILFILYIKITNIALVLVPLMIGAMNFKTLTKNIGKKLLKISSLAIIVLTVFIVKNMIVCGSPFFPSKLFGSFKLDYAVPNIIENFYYDQVKYRGFLVDYLNYSKMTGYDLFLRWLTLPKLNGLFNKTAIMLLLTTPFFIYKFQNIKAVWSLYLLMLVQFIVLFSTSPQYRFFTNFIIFFFLFCLVWTIRNLKIIHFFFVFSQLLTIFFLFVPINLNRFSNSEFMLEISNFSTKNLIHPYKNTKYDTKFEPIKTGNLKYNSPDKINFFWAAGDGDLPAVNKEQIDYFQTYFHIVPQMRSKDLKDGFYSKIILPNESIRTQGISR